MMHSTLQSPPQVAQAFDKVSEKLKHDLTQTTNDSIERIFACNKSLDRIAFESKELAPLIADIKLELNSEVDYIVTKSHRKNAHKKKKSLKKLQKKNLVDDGAACKQLLSELVREIQRLTARINWARLMLLFKRQKTESKNPAIKKSKHTIQIGIENLVKTLGPADANDSVKLTQLKASLEEKKRLVYSKAPLYHSVEFYHERRRKLLEVETAVEQRIQQLARALDESFQSKLDLGVVPPGELGNIIRRGAEEGLLSASKEVLDCQDRFHVAFTNEQYSAAAWIAIQCPFRFLRNQQTWRLFWKATEVCIDGCSPKDHKDLPIIQYCTALIENNIDGDESVQCASVSIEYNCLSLLEHWIMTDQLQNTEQLARLLAKRATDMPDDIISKLLVVVCQRINSKYALELAVKELLNQNRPRAAVNFASNNGLEVNDMLKHVRSSPTHAHRLAEGLGTTACHNMVVPEYMSSLDEHLDSIETDQLVDIVATSLAKETVSLCLKESEQLNNDGEG